MTWLIIQVWSMPKTELSFCDLFDWVLSEMKTRHNNDIIECLGGIYTENNIELL